MACIVYTRQYQYLVCLSSLFYEHKLVCMEVLLGNLAHNHVLG
jgi:hypothetical protein